MKKYWKEQKDVMLPNAGKYGLSTVGAVGTAIALSHEKVLPGYKKWAAVGVWTAGLLSAVFNPEQYSSAALQGAGNAASIFATAAFMKKPGMYGINPDAVDLKAVETKNEKGEVTGTTYEQVDKNGNPVKGMGNPSDFWKEMANRAVNNDEPTAGTDEATPTDGLAADEQELADMVEELLG